MFTDIQASMAIDATATLIYETGSQYSLSLGNLQCRGDVSKI